MPTTKPGWLDHRATLTDLIALSQAEAVAQLGAIFRAADPPEAEDVGGHPDLAVKEGLASAMGVLIVVVLYALAMRQFGR